MKVLFWNGSGPGGLEQISSPPPGARPKGEPVVHWSAGIWTRVGRCARWGALTVRHERRTDILMTFLHLGCPLICGRNATRAANDVDHRGAAVGSGGGRMYVLGR